MRYHHYKQQILQRNLDRYLFKNGVQFVEGNSAGFPEQQEQYLQLASIGCVKWVCEVGFNAGHSTTVWLSAKPNLRVSSFDLGGNDYYKTALDFFGTNAKLQRVQLTLGDSLQTIPKAIAEGRHPRCDMIVVDGGHDFQTAMGDILNLRSLAAQPFNVLVVDDTYCSSAWCSEPTSALQAAEKHGLVSVMKVVTNTDGTRGFTVGRYLPNPPQDANQG